MKGSYVILGIELEGIRNFLQSVVSEAGAEIQSILKKNDAGELEGEDDLENALYHPLIRQEIAARAVFYELNALIEHELQRSANLPWLESGKAAAWPSKMIEDLPYNRVVPLIEEKYDIRIGDLAGAEGFLKTREMVNSFKHQKGLIDFRKEDPKPFVFPRYHESDIEQAYEAIDNALVFIEALWQATHREPALRDWQAT